MPTINNQSIIEDITKRLKNLIASGITDPISSTRTGSSAFVMTSFPEKRAEYPMITLRINLGASEHLGMQSEGKLIPVLLFIDVWSKNVGMKDWLAGSVFNVLRENQYGTNTTTGSGTVLERLYDFRLLNMVDLDEPGAGGVHRKSIQCQYQFVTI